MIYLQHSLVFGGLIKMIRKNSYTDSEKFQIIKQQYTLDNIDYTDVEAITIIDKNTHYIRLISYIF